MGKRESAPQVNAGSMADIAFLLLIFFLVTTSIETDAGLNRMLPRDDGEIIEYEQRNILSVLIDDKSQLLINEKLVSAEDLKKLAIEFIDNGGASTEEDFCDYCRGGKIDTSSDNPQKAVIVLTTQRKTSYGTYIAVQNELVSGYNVLRNREANRLFNMDYTLMEEQYRNQQTAMAEREILGQRIKTIQKMFPLNISEAELKNQ